MPVAHTTSWCGARPFVRFAYIVRLCRLPKWTNANERKRERTVRQRQRWSRGQNGRTDACQLGTSRIWITRWTRRKQQRRQQPRQRTIEIVVQNVFSYFSFPHSAVHSYSLLNERLGCVCKFIGDIPYLSECVLWRECAMHKWLIARTLRTFVPLHCIVHRMCYGILSRILWFYSFRLTCFMYSALPLRFLFSLVRRCDASQTTKNTIKLRMHTASSPKWTASAVRTNHFNRWFMNGTLWNEVNHFECHQMATLQLNN